MAPSIGLLPVRNKPLLSHPGSHKTFNSLTLYMWNFFEKKKKIHFYRDDVVFLVLLYQRWIYRVDYSRVNEYGQVNEGMVEDVGTAEGAKKETKKTK